MDVSKQIEHSKIRGHKFIDNYAYSIKSFVRVITDKEIKFPLNHQIKGGVSQIKSLWVLRYFICGNNLKLIFKLNNNAHK